MISRSALHRSGLRPIGAIGYEGRLDYGAVGAVIILPGPCDEARDGQSDNQKPGECEQVSSPNVGELPRPRPVNLNVTALK
jgi:hypothetical protein